MVSFRWGLALTRRRAGFDFDICRSLHYCDYFRCVSRMRDGIPAGYHHSAIVFHDRNRYMVMIDRKSGTTSHVDRSGMASMRRYLQLPMKAAM